MVVHEFLKGHVSNWAAFGNEHVEEINILSPLQNVSYCSSQFNRKLHRPDVYSGQVISFLSAGFFFAACLSFTLLVGPFGSDCLLWSAQFLAPHLPSECLLGPLRSIVIQIMRIRSHHCETCFSAGTAAAIYRSQVGCAWKRTCLVYLILVFSECLLLFLGSCQLW